MHLQNALPYLAELREVIVAKSQWRADHQVIPAELVAEYMGAGELTMLEKRVIDYLLAHKSLRIPKMSSECADYVAAVTAIGLGEKLMQTTIGRLLDVRRGAIDLREDDDCVEISISPLLLHCHNVGFTDCLQGKE